MKISLSWLKDLISIDKSPEEISALLSGCGLEVEQLEYWQSLKGGLKNVVTGKVLTCEKHPNADRLHVTTVDTGEAEPRNIVCGAPNIAAGQHVIVALPGAMMFPFKGDAFEIKKSKIRGVVSDGMICAEDELGMGESHAGVLVLPDTTKTGIPAADYFKLTEDWIFEIGLTPNRADAASHLGVARDLKALSGKDNPLNIAMPDVSKFKVHNNDKKISAEIKDHDGCSRYSAVEIKNVSVKESPQWLKNRLSSIGIRSINNIVDITNYVMHYLGQPLHAFDADKISGNKIIVGTLPKGTKFKTLDETDRELNGTELMIADAKGGLCIAGVFGGIDSGVSETTKNIFLESACFNPVRIRKAARAHGLHTDSSFRFERGTDPEMTITALKFAALLIEDLAGGSVSSEITDIYPVPAEWKKISIRFDYINTLCGNEIAKSDIKRILTDLQIKIVSENNEGLELEIPPFKVEVTRPADIVEEILRIYGYNAVVLPKKLNISVAPVAKPDPEEIYFRLGEWLVANGYNEVMNNSLTRMSDEEVLPLPGGVESVKIINPLSNDLGMMRHQMLLTGLQSVAYNLNRKQTELKLFETGKTYLKINGKYRETYYLAIWITGDRHDEHWKIRSAEYDIYYLKSVVNNLFQSVGIDSRVQLSLSELNTTSLQSSLLYEVDGKRLASFGQVKKNILKPLDISQPVWYAEINLEELMHLVPVKDKSVPAPPRFPEVRRDLSMVIDREVKYTAIENIAYATEPALLKRVNLFDVYEGEKLGEGKKSYALSFLLSDPDATLQDKQIDVVMNKLMKQFESKLGAVIRKQ